MKSLLMKFNRWLSGILDQPKNEQPKVDQPKSIRDGCTNFMFDIKCSHSSLFDEYENRSPKDLASEIRKVLEEANNLENIDFNVELSEHILRVLQAWEYSDDGFDFIRKYQSRVYSYFGLHFFTDTSETVLELSNNIFKSIDDDCRAIVHFLTEDFFESTTFIHDHFLTLSFDKKYETLACIRKAAHVVLAKQMLRTRTDAGEIA